MNQKSELQILLEKMEESSRKQVRYARLQFIFSLISAICCVLLLFAVLKYIPQLQALTAQIQDIAVQLQGLATQAETVMTNLETVTAELAQANLAEMVNNVNDLVIASQEGIQQALDKLNAIDFEELNQAIANLSAVIEPLARIVKAFG